MEKKPKTFIPSLIASLLLASGASLAHTAVPHGEAVPHVHGVHSAGQGSIFQLSARVALPCLPVTVRSPLQGGPIFLRLQPIFHPAHGGDGSDLTVEDMAGLQVQIVDESFSAAGGLAEVSLAPAGTLEFSAADLAAAPEGSFTEVAGASGAALPAQEGGVGHVLPIGTGQTCLYVVLGVFQK